MQTFALLLDGGFVKKKIEGKTRSSTTVQNICTLRDSVVSSMEEQGYGLYRIFFYDAPPFSGSKTNPISGVEVNYSMTSIARSNMELLDSLEMLPDFAVRRGELLHVGWRLGWKALKSLAREKRALEERDILPNFRQKGVDLRIGLDIASLAYKRIVDSIVVVAGDSDLVPAMKLARKEGLRVFLVPLGHGVRRELKVHADRVIDVELPAQA